MLLWSFFCCCRKNSRQKHLKEGRVCFGSRIERTACHGEEVEAVGGCMGGAASHIPSTVRKPSDKCPRSTPFLLSLQPRTQTHGSMPPTLDRLSHFKEHSHHTPSQCAWSLACWEIPKPVKLGTHTNHHMPMFMFDPVTKLKRPLSTQWAGRMQILPNVHLFPGCCNLWTRRMSFYSPYIQNSPSFLHLHMPVLFRMSGATSVECPLACPQPSMSSAVHWGHQTVTHPLRPT